MAAHIQTLIMTALMLASLSSVESFAGYEFATPGGSEPLKLRIRSNAKPEPKKYKPGSDCKSIRSHVEAIVGKAKSACYMKLFLIESTCDYTRPQAQGNVGNAYAAYGLCSIENDVDVRESQNRGPDCKKISTIDQQIRCCRAMVKQTSKKNSYFGPIRRGEVSKCE